MVMYIRTVGKALLNLTSIDLYLFDTLNNGYVINSSSGALRIDKASGKRCDVGRIDSYLIKYLK